VAIVVPENGYLNSLGSDWRCDRGFRKVEAACLAFSMPPNSHINYSGNEWECDPGYRRESDRCTVNQRRPR